MSFRILAFIITISSIGLNKNIYAQNDTLIQETKRIEADACFSRLRIGERLIISNQQKLDSMTKIRNNDHLCQELLDNFDFRNYSICGINLNTGWCREPKDLKINVYKFDKRSEIEIKINYQAPITPCAALSYYNIWLIIPQTPKRFNVNFNIIAKETERN